MQAVILVIALIVRGVAHDFRQLNLLCILTYVLALHSLDFQAFFTAERPQGYLLLSKLHDRTLTFSLCRHCYYLWAPLLFKTTREFDYNYQNSLRAWRHRASELFSPTLLASCVFLSHSETLHCQIAKLVLITQQTKSKSLFELFEERFIVSVGDYFCCIHIFSANLFKICSQTSFNLKYIQKLEIYEFDVRLIFTPMCGARICHVLLTVQKPHRRPLFIDNRHFIGFLDKQN